MTHNPQSQKSLTKKIRNLSNLEARLHAASDRAEQAGYYQRAAAYSQQAAAVAREKERWNLVANTPPAPSSAPHLFASFLIIVFSLLDLSVFSGQAARRIARAVLTIGVLVCAIVVGTSPPSAWRDAQVSEPEPWALEFAAREHLMTSKDRHERQIASRSLPF